VLILTLSRGKQIDITLEDGRVLKLHAIDGDAIHFRIGFDVPKSILVDRHEVTLRKQREVEGT
jgi:sRNA-binding carbon storage regulator CsrA